MEALGPSLMILLALVISALVTFSILYFMEDAGSKQELDDYLKDFSEWPPER